MRKRLTSKTVAYAAGPTSAARRTAIAGIAELSQATPGLRASKSSASITTRPFGERTYCGSTRGCRAARAHRQQWRSLGACLEKKRLVKKLRAARDRAGRRVIVSKVVH